ncbi:MAG: hypothetical protein K2K57_04310 [Oscillospiraceae bacterium]|nr:hypothetical protein [Oscillospiraceae bacterium]
MKKKILSLFLAAAAVLSMTAGALAADEKEARTAAAPKDAATFTFDTDVCMSYIHPFGSASDTNLQYNLEDKAAVSGRCLRLSEDFAQDISNQYGGIYFLASDLGLENFAGHTMTVKVKVTSAAAKAAPNMVLFSDGVSWISQNFSTDSAGSWITATVSVPADSANNKLGISIPITQAFTGDVLFLDDITIADNYGSAIANVGDVDTSLAEAPNTVASVLTTILFIVLIIAVIGGIVLVVLKMIRRYR